MVDLYSTGCPKCRILEKKLSDEGIAYEKHTDVDEMLKLGLMSAPALGVDGKLLDFASAVQWIKQQKE